MDTALKELLDYGTLGVFAVLAVMALVAMWKVNIRFHDIVERNTQAQDRAGAAVESMAKAVTAATNANRRNTTAMVKEFRVRARKQ
jgi:hypothetical protein